MIKELFPLESSFEAAEAIAAVMKEYNYPANPANAARVGWRAARLWAQAQAYTDNGAAEKTIESFQERVQPWMMVCFGDAISQDKVERNNRFTEEALELVQSLGMPREDAHALVDYVYGRPVGDPPQEVGGVMVTLAALCLANAMDMHECGEIELARIWTKVEQIRAKQAAKPKFGPLPGTTE